MKCETYFVYIIFLFVTLMGYSYLDVFENEHEVKIANSLLMMLRGENCASTLQIHSAAAAP